MERLISKVIDHGAIIKVRRHPTQFSDMTMKVEHEIKRSKQSGRGKSPKTLKGRGRISPLGAFNPDEFSGNPLINQHGAVRRFDYVKQLWEGVMLDASAEGDGVSKQRHSLLVREESLWVVRDSCGFHKEALGAS